MLTCGETFGSYMFGHHPCEFRIDQLFHQLLFGQYDMWIHCYHEYEAPWNIPEIWLKIL